MVHIQRAKGLLARLEQHPEEHNQFSWGKQEVLTSGCLTTLCAAGTTCMLAGAELRWQDCGNGVLALHYASTDVLPVKDRVFSVTGEYVYWGNVGYVAQKLLGLSTDEANLLFFEARDLAEVKEVLEPLIEEAERQAFEAENKRVMHQIFADHRQAKALAGV
jgi:hypothetical protein